MGEIKRFKWSNLGETDAIADGDTFRWYLCKCEDMDKLVEFMNELASENTQLRKDLIDYSALVRMLESYTGLSIEYILYNKTGAESQEEFDKIHKTYHDKAKQWWGKEE